MTPTRTHSQRSGFTIVELVVAMVVLTIGLLASASVIAGVTRRQMSTTSRIEMMTIADNKLEDLRVLAVSRSDDTVSLAIGGSITTPTGIYTDVATTPDGKQYRRLWQVSAGPAGTRTVTLRVKPVMTQKNEMKKMDFTAYFLVL